MGGKTQTDILTEQGAEELTLEDIDDSVQGLVQLVVFLPQTLCDATLLLVSVLQFGPVLLQELQGSLGIYTRNQQLTNCDIQTASLSKCDGKTSEVNTVGLIVVLLLQLAWALFTLNAIAISSFFCLLTTTVQL